MLLPMKMVSTDMLMPVILTGDSFILTVYSSYIA